MLLEGIGIAAELAAAAEKTAEVAVEMAEATAEAAEVTSELAHSGEKASVSFGSLAGEDLKRDPRYIKWQDGVSRKEVSPKWMSELTKKISEIYGYDTIGVDIDRRIQLGIFSEVGELRYAPKFLSEIAKTCGEDTIVGGFAHEVGHRMAYNLGLTDNVRGINELTKNTYIEACSDYIAGMVTRFGQLNPEHMCEFYRTYNRKPLAANGYPSDRQRVEAFMRGYTRIDRGPEARTGKIFEPFRVYDQHKVYHNKELLKQILIEDVIHPYLTGSL
jgi:hypothetical protein